VDTAGYNVTLAGNLSDATGPGTLIKTGAGMLTLSGVNTYTGGTTVLAGALDVTSPSALASNGVLTIDSGGLMILGSTSGGGDAAPADTSSPAPAAATAATSTTAGTSITALLARLHAKVAAASTSTATAATAVAATDAAATSADPTATATATATTPATAATAATDTPTPAAAPPSTATATAADATTAVTTDTGTTSAADAPVDTSDHVDVSGSQAGASPATVASSGAGVDGSKQNSAGDSVVVVPAHPEADASGSIATYPSGSIVDARFATSSSVEALLDAALVSLVV
jgi:autotransporter-associated beta strand protein